MKRAIDAVKQTASLMRDAFEAEIADKGPKYNLKHHPLLKTGKIYTAEECIYFIPAPQHPSPMPVLEDIIMSFEGVDALLAPLVKQAVPAVSSSASPPSASIQTPGTTAQPVSTIAMQSTISAKVSSVESSPITIDKDQLPWDDDRPPAEPIPLGIKIKGLDDDVPITASLMEIAEYIDYYTSGAAFDYEMRDSKEQLANMSGSGGVGFNSSKPENNRVSMLKRSSSKSSLKTPNVHRSSSNAHRSPSLKKTTIIPSMIVPSAESASLQVVIVAQPELAPGQSPNNLAKITTQQSKNNTFISPETRKSHIQDMIQLAIKLQEQGQLENAFQLYCIVAHHKHPIGLLLCAMALRHGWGCEVDLDTAIACLEQAVRLSAEEYRITIETRQNARVMDASNAQQLFLMQRRGTTQSLSELELKLAPEEGLLSDIPKHELAMSLYELGQCYRFGWGCRRSSSAAVMFYRLAADLGDADAQSDLGHCYEDGWGVTQDKYMASLYLRLAMQQGRQEFGSSWVFKDKYEAFFRERFPNVAGNKSSGTIVNGMNES